MKNENCWCLLVLQVWAKSRFSYPGGSVELWNNGLNIVVGGSHEASIADWPGVVGVLEASI